MTTPRTRARGLRGALVGGCSAVITSGAHAAAGGTLPAGSALLLVGLVCAVVGAILAGAVLDGRGARFTAITGGLLTAQALGHLTLVVAAGHHHGGLGVTWSMAAAHLAGAVLLGAAISVVEYLYLVCVSVLCWLRLFATARRQPAAPRRPAEPRQSFAQSVLWASGLGMRAPPLA
ncbi:hypothetical protein CRI77_01710 [Mycolicibacterium duvalii]|uniref:hypothetical protein n=1 Tax=Mycolicibacterium duvalii TaxID=39688 RepID=UPI000BEEB6E5|nr:hypothetical protein [Mycolicibacterium duvalii]MCV7367559.1 hypothetical protein [Mycolicibacterium duvalii]PEG44121.1 hypothetical protein CRI77_01710 [Mycolicibacterium duvalii]